MPVAKHKIFLLNFRKVFRFIKIYGISRTLTKIAGRFRFFNAFKPKYLKSRPYIGLIGCGQFQFSTIAYFLSRGWVNVFLFCYDIDASKAYTLGKYYNVKNILVNKKDLEKVENPALVYIASNHASHAEYAQEYLKKNIDVFSEKPIAVSIEQLDRLLIAIKKSDAKFYAGYNRPFSSAIINLKKRVRSLDKTSGKFTLNCFISAHDIPPEHWYRDLKEGTRICGNVGHWLDLMIHMYNWRGYIPTCFNVQVAYACIIEPDDNISITLTTPQDDLTSITVTSRSEPFEGINETINFQYDKLIAKIDDFRRMTVWENDKLYNKRYWPKDVGHRKSVQQPFIANDTNRSLNEIIASTELMLRITEMVNEKDEMRNIELERINEDSK